MNSRNQIEHSKSGNNHRKKNTDVKIFTQGTVAKLLAASGLCLLLFGVNEIGTRSEMERIKKAGSSKPVPAQVKPDRTPNEPHSPNASVAKK